MSCSSTATCFSTPNTCPQSLVTGVSAYAFFALINSLFSKQCQLSPAGIYPENIGPNLQNNEKFDFIIVGSGSAGSVLANRLTENSSWNVLLLENGGYPSTSSEIPLVFFYLLGTDEDYKYVTQETPGCHLSMKQKKSNWPRGKALGGTSTINANLYLRGNKRDHDTWANMGNPGWDYKSVFPYYLKSENIEVPILENSPAHHKGGYLTTSRTILKQPIREVLVNGSRELGYNYYDDQVNLGTFDALTTIENGVRCSSCKAFLSKIKRKNLHVATNAFVKKIIIDKNSKTAKGVVVSINGTDRTVYATKEVIVSAGAINSPQLLMLSGVGPKEHLKSFGIDVIEDLPVGENLQDHLCLPAMTIDLPKHLYDPGDPNDNIYNYFMHRTGVFGTNGILNFHGFINTKNDSEYPNIEYHHLIFDTQQDYLHLLTSVNYIDEVLQTKSTAPLLMILPALLNPKSFGKILLASTKPEDKPLIYPNFLSDKNGEDLQTLLESIKFLMKLLETKPFKNHKLDFTPFNIPNCKNLTFKSDDYWRCVIRNIAVTIYHPAGTCKMGEKQNKGVVNAQLQVHGIKNLRVIDASIMPLVTSCNTNVPTIMIAEKGADLVKTSWGMPTDPLKFCDFSDGY